VVDVTDLRPYQLQAVADIEQALLTQNVLFTLPTGGGKTVIGAKVIENASPAASACLCCRIAARSPSRHRSSFPISISITA
jgi:superfamily II DNA or RNA helicase